MGKNSCTLPVFLALTASLLSPATKAEVSKLKEYNLDLESICSIKVTPEGDVYAFGYSHDDNHSLAYTVFKNNLESTFKGKVHSPTGGRASCSSSLEIIPGNNDNFYVPANWIVDHHDADYASSMYLYNIKFKDDQSDILLSKENVHLEKFFFDKTRSTLYASTYATWSKDRHHTTVTAVDVSTKMPLWSENFMHGSLGSIISPDSTLLYLLGENKAQLISLIDQTVISDGPSLITGLNATMDDKNNVYAGRAIGSKTDIFMAKLQPFTSPADPLRWQSTDSENLKPSPINSPVIAPNGLLYVSSSTRPETAGVLEIDTETGKQRALIHAPKDESGDHLMRISPTVFDKETAMGYSFTSMLAQGYPQQKMKDYIWRYDIWGFSPEIKQAEPLFSIKAGNNKPQGFMLANNHIYLAVKDTLYVYDLDQKDSEQDNPGVILDGPDNYTSEQADQGVTIHYQAPPASEGRSDYYLFSLNAERKKFGSYQKIKAGSRGVAKVKIYKSWHPQGGEFIIGLASDANRPGTVKEIGDTVRVTVTP